MMLDSRHRSSYALYGNKSGLEAAPTCIQLGNGRNLRLVGGHYYSRRFLDVVACFLQQDEILAECRRHRRNDDILNSDCLGLRRWTSVSSAYHSWLMSRRMDC